MAAATRSLAPDAPVEGRLSGGQVDTFEIQLAEDQFIRLVAEQHGLDVLLRLFDPDGQELTEVDTPDGAQGAEELIEVAAAAGLYRLEVHAAGGDLEGGSYRLYVAELRPAVEADWLRVTADHSFNSGEALRRLRKPISALGAYRRAAREWKALDDRTRYATCRYRMGWMKHTLGAWQQAEVDFIAALDALESDGAPALRAAILNRCGRTMLQSALVKLEQACQAHEKALDLFRGLHDLAGEAAALNNLGMAHERTDPTVALRDYQQATELWTQLGEAGEKTKTQGNVARFQARLEGAPPPAGGAPGSSGASLAAAHSGGGAALGSCGGGPGEARARTRLAAAMARSGRLEAAGGYYADAFAPVLDGETLVLRYELGEERSIVWTAGGSGRSPTASHRVLSGRAPIEAAARTLFESASREGAEAERRRRQAAAALSQMLLAPVAADLGRHRLVFVVDGGLDRVPFALLPEPGSGAAPHLLESHEIVHLPAATAATIFSKRPERAGLAVPGPAVMGAPVLRSDDPRLGGLAAGAVRRAELPPDLAAALARLGLNDLPPLPWSLPEAEAVIALAPPIASPHVLGFDANLDALRGGGLRGYRIQHLAALVVHTADASGIVLSCFDSRGEPRGGFLRLDELRRLDLRAELLVVTGTLLDWDAAAGGLGLVSAAMKAGAARVLTCLWSAGDESGVELMRQFYQASLRNHLPPAAALRQAQLAIAGETRWSAPRHWAGFLFAGDWSLSRFEASDAGGTIEASDKGGAGDSGKPGNDLPPGCTLPEGMTFDEEAEA